MLRRAINYLLFFEEVVIFLDSLPVPVVSEALSAFLPLPC